MDPTSEPDSPSSCEPIAESVPVGRSGPLRVLLVEDEIDHADLVAAYLDEAGGLGAELTHASTVGRALTALSEARSSGRPFDVVLCDQRLPDSEYWESVSRVVGAAGRAPVVALTSIGDAEIAVDAMRQGAQDYLVKSELSGEVLRRTIRYAVERARHVGEIQALNEALETRVREQAARLRALSARLAAAEQEERRRIALLLHDDLQQRLYALSITLDLLTRASSDEERAQIVARAERTLTEATDLTRTLAKDLNPAILGTARLDHALRWLAERAQEAHGLEVEVEGEVEVPDPTLRALLYHLVRELLFNAAKHAGAPSVRVELADADDSVSVCVRDEGRGFDVVALSNAEGGFGLASVRERLEGVGGCLAIESAPGEGTSVTLMVPVDATVCDDER